MSRVTNDKPLPLMIQFIIRVISAIPIIKDVFDKEFLTEIAKKHSTYLIYFTVACLVLLSLPLIFLLLPSKDNNIIWSIQVFCENHWLLYYAIIILLLGQFATLRVILTRYKAKVKLIVFVLVAGEVAFLGLFCKSLLWENKYSSGPLSARKLYLDGKYGEALKTIKRMKKDRRWRYLIHENNVLENRIITTEAYSDTLEKRLADLAEKKSYLELLDLLLFQSKIVPKAKYTSYYVKTVSDVYASSIASLTGNKRSGPYFSKEQKIVSDYLSGKKLNIYKYDSIQLAAAFSLKDSLGTAKKITNDSLIRTWIAEIKKGLSD